MTTVKTSTGNEGEIVKIDRGTTHPSPNSPAELVVNRFDITLASAQAMEPG